MIGAFAAFLPGCAQRSQARRMLAPLALGAMGVLIGCNFTTTPAPAPPTSTYSTLQTPNRGDSPLQIQFVAPNGELMADYQTSLHLAGTSP
jgi:hypothetical protein